MGARWILSLALVGLTQCAGGVATGGDSGVRDAEVAADAGRTDASALDASNAAFDGGSNDAGLGGESGVEPNMDAAVSDALPSDADLDAQQDAGCVDLDGDGYGDGPECLGPDCDDESSLVNPARPELCDGVDNDCDPETEDGSDDLSLRIACDSEGDIDLCPEDQPTCVAGEVQCEASGEPLPELCDQVDNDCNPATPDGADVAMVGTPCESAGDPDRCEDDAVACVDGMLRCVDMGQPLPDLCDQMDNDCNPSTPDGADEPGFDDPCDFTDTDLCEDDRVDCVAGVLGCTDRPNDLADVCDGVDNDCDPSTAEGSGETGFGTTCDTCVGTSCQCGSGPACGGGQQCCGGSCVDVSSSGAHCGACGRSCGGDDCCGGTCVDTDSDTDHCGSCDNECLIECLLGICFPL